MGVMETGWTVNGPRPIQRNWEGPLSMDVGRPIGERMDLDAWRKRFSETWRSLDESGRCD